MALLSFSSLSTPLKSSLISLLLFCCIQIVQANPLFPESAPSDNSQSDNTQTSNLNLGSLNLSDDSFLNVEEAYQLNVEFGQDENGKAKATLIWQAAPNYYLYKHGFKHQAQQENHSLGVNAELPPGIHKVDEYFGEVETYYNQVVIPLDIEEHDGKAYLKAQSQGCADAGLCYPPHDVFLEIDLLNGEASTISLEAYQAQADNGANTLQSNNPDSKQAANSDTGISFWLALISAFIGGLILNLMPCVLPVLSIKLMQLHSMGSHAKQHGLAYMAGVVLSFTGVAALMLALKSAGHAIGWGFQLQQPWFVALLALVFFALGLSMSGFFELGSRLMGLGQNQTSNEQEPKLSSAFNTGVLAVVVASPCTAPFMGAALGFAVTQSTLTALSVFAALGLGMAFPLTLLTFIPRMQMLMPKPGLWMVRLKEFFAFPLYATVVWLLWVLSNQTSSTTMAIMLLAMIGLSFAIWCLRSSHWLSRATAIIVLAGIASLFTTPYLAPQPQEANKGHLAYSAQALQALRDDNQAVFIDLTADWCITCLANEQSTLNTDEVQAAFKAANIHYMVGDWTNYNEGITALLSQYNRSGIPLYLLFPADKNAEPLILPQLLNTQIVLEAINSLQNNNK